MITLGIDPGLSGALALVETESGNNARAIALWDMPTETEKMSGGRTRRRVSAPELLALLWGIERAPDCVALEYVSASPGMGAVSAFSFGHGVGVITGCIHAIFPHARIITPAPSRWKPALGLSRDKAASRDLAASLVPDSAARFARVKDDGRAEAALLAIYAARVQV